MKTVLTRVLEGTWPADENEAVRILQFSAHRARILQRLQYELVRILVHHPHAFRYGGKLMLAQILMTRQKTSRSWLRQLLVVDPFFERFNWTAAKPCVQLRKLLTIDVSLGGGRLWPIHSEKLALYVHYLRKAEQRQLDLPGVVHHILDRAHIVWQELALRQLVLDHLRHPALEKLLIDLDQHQAALSIGIKKY